VAEGKQSERNEKGQATRQTLHNAAQRHTDLQIPLQLAVQALRVAELFFQLQPGVAFQREAIQRVVHVRLFVDQTVARRRQLRFPPEVVVVLGRFAVGTGHACDVFPPVGARWRRVVVGVQP